MSKKHKKVGSKNMDIKTKNESSFQSLAEMWQTTFDAVKEAIWVLDADWNILHANKATTQIFGLQPNQIIGSKCYELVHGTKEPIPNCPVRRVEEKLEREIEELQFGERHLEIIADPIINSDGSFDGVVHLVSDITQRKKSEEALRLSEKRFFTIFNSNPAPIAITKANDNKLVQVNNAWENFTGYSKKEAVGNTPFDLNLWVYSEQRDEIRKKLDESEVVNEEVRIRKKSGDICDLLYSAEIIELEGEKYFLSMGQDITELQQYKFDLIQEKEKAARYLNNSGVMFVGLDTDGTVTLSNKMTHHILEIEESDMKGKNWFDHFIPQTIRQEVKKIFQELVKGNIEPVKYFENEVLTSKGAKRYVAWHNSYITGDDGKISSVLSAGVDITDKKKLESRLQQAQKMEAIGTLAGGIAHDFNNILSSVLGFSQIALGELDKKENLKDDLQEIVTAGMRARDLVQQILTFARQTDEKLQPVRVDLVTKEVIKLIRSSIPTTIQIDEKIESKSMILGSTTQVHQILMNLCTNSAYAMEENGGTLKISLKDTKMTKETHKLKDGLKEGDYIEIKVSDTGTGIPEKIIDSIFEPYFTTKEIGEGTGMGLAVVHGIVESYGGKINVRSVIGKGTDFITLLPVYDKKKPKHFNEEKKFLTGNEKVLFLDDEAPIAKMGGRTLEQLGYRVTTMTVSTEALQLFRSKPDDFDLVITDMTMPEMTGDQFAHELIKIRPDIPIILCTGYSKKISNGKFKESDIKALVHKPITKAIMSKTVRKVLDESKNQF